MGQGEIPSAAGGVAAWPRVVPALGGGSWCSGFIVVASFLAAERQMFLATWKDIPNENEAQFQIKDCSLNAGVSRPFTRAAAGDQLIPVTPVQAGRARARLVDTSSLP